MARVDTYAMVNLIAGQRVVRELIQDDCTPEAIADEAVRLLTEQDYRSRMIASLEEYGGDSADRGPVIARRRQY